MKLASTAIITVLLLNLPITAGSEVVVQAVGDIMLGGRWGNSVSRIGYFYPFEKVSPELAKGDITIANLEAPLTSRGKEFKEKRFRFRAKAAVADALKKAGVTTVSLANNHIMDFGSEGLKDTILSLDKAGIDYVGAGENLGEARKAAIYNIRGLRVAILGYSLTLPQEFWASINSPGTTPLTEKVALEDIDGIRKDADIIVITVHWGEEGARTLRPYQKRLARMMIDAGADAVIGHHPHILQGIEQYRHGIIFYSLGNFVFASKGKAGGSTLIVRLFIDGTNRSVELLPVNTGYREVGFQPQMVHGHKADEAIEKIRSLPSNSADIRKENGRYMIRYQSKP